MARCPYHPNGSEDLSQEQLLGPSEIPAVELFRRVVNLTFPNEAGFWTSCLEVVWTDLERLAGQGKAIHIMLESLQATLKKERADGPKSNPHLRYLHAVLVARVEEAEFRAHGLESDPFEFKF